MAFTKQQVGFFAFVAGLFIALFIAVAYQTIQPVHIYSLALLGIIIGLLNIEAKEVWPYIVASTAFILAANGFNQVLDNLPVVSLFLERFVQALIYIVGPGVVVVSLRIIYEASRSRESLPHPLREEKAARKSAKKSRKR